MTDVPLTESVSTMRTIYRYEGAFEYLHASLITSLANFRNCCEVLLCGLALPDSQLYKLIEAIDDTSWEDSNLDSMIRRKLGSNYLPFKLSVKQLHKKIALLGRKLKLEKDFRVPWVSEAGAVDERIRARFFRNPFDRIIGGLYSAKLKALLSSLDDDINRVITLVSGAIALEPLRLERKRKRNVAYWATVQQQAKQLYEVFNSQWSSSSTCRCIHWANLRLEMQGYPDSDQPPTFKLLFTIERNMPVTQSIWNWHTAEVLQSPVVKARTGNSRSNYSNTRTACSSAIFDKENQWARCQMSAPRIKSLCYALGSTKSISKKSCCIGVWEEAKVQHHIHAIPLPRPKPSTITVQEVLRNSTQSGFQIKVKCSLALTLATMVLHLHDTPWIGENWTLSDIHLVDPKALISDQPYVSRRFSVVHNTDVSTQSVQRLRIVKNSTIFALGVALLEISHGRSLTSFETPDDLDRGKRLEWTDYLIADRLAEGMPTRELPNYAEATRRCIHCNFDSLLYDLNDNDFKERFYQGVIVPLQKDYDYVMGRVGT